MSTRWMTRLLAASAVLAVPICLRAEDAPEAKPDQRPDPAAVFQRLDANRDGKIIKDELRDERGTRLLERLDKDGDGAVSREEFTGGTRVQPPRVRPSEPPTTPPERREPGRPEPGTPAETPAQGPSVEMMLRRILQLDANSDGKLSKEEAPPRIAENFDRIDTNGDGLLDEAELRKMAELMVRRMRDAPQRPAGKRPDAPRPKQAPAQPNPPKTTLPGPTT